jgi:hypothetical protein
MPAPAANRSRPDAGDAAACRVTLAPASRSWTLYRPGRRLIAPTVVAPNRAGDAASYAVAWPESAYSPATQAIAAVVNVGEEHS